MVLIHNYYCFTPSNYVYLYTCKLSPFCRLSSKTPAVTRHYRYHLQEMHVIHIIATCSYGSRKISMHVHMKKNTCTYAYVGVGTDFWLGGLTGPNFNSGFHLSLC